MRILPKTEEEIKNEIRRLEEKERLICEKFSNIEKPLLEAQREIGLKIHTANPSDKPLFMQALSDLEKKDIELGIRFMEKAMYPLQERTLRLKKRLKSIKRLQGMKEMRKIRKIKRI